MECSVEWRGHCLPPAVEPPPAAATRGNARRPPAAAVPAGGTSTIPALGLGSRRSRPPPRPAEATVLSRTAADSRGPLPDRITQGHRAPWESVAPSGPTE